MSALPNERRCPDSATATADWSQRASCVGPAGVPRFSFRPARGGEALEAPEGSTPPPAPLGVWSSQAAGSLLVFVKASECFAQRFPCLHQFRLNTRRCPVPPRESLNVLQYRFDLFSHHLIV